MARMRVALRHRARASRTARLESAFSVGELHVDLRRAPG